jgi:hypothetical protein
MVLFANLKDVKTRKREYNPVPVLELTMGAEVEV